MKARKKVVLVTGFEPYGGYARNPSAEIARRLDGTRIGGVPVVGRLLPVDLAALDRALAGAVRGLDPLAVVLLGLAPGEPVIRLERVALNLADFPIADNAGTRAVDRRLDAQSGPALWSRLPLRAIQAQLLAAGIPARLSETAGTYLCNAAMHWALRRLPARVPAGFIHLPLLPAQVAARLGQIGDAMPAASMALAVQKRAVEIALKAILAESQRGGHKRITSPGATRRSGPAKALTKA
jgi:pyroglutamyl-peptidase